MQPVLATVMQMQHPQPPRGCSFILLPHWFTIIPAGFAGLSSAQDASQFNTIRAALQDLGATDFITILEAATGTSILDNEDQAVR